MWADEKASWWILVWSENGVKQGTEKDLTAGAEKEDDVGYDSLLSELLFLEFAGRAGASTSGLRPRLKKFVTFHLPHTRARSDFGARHC